MPRQARHVRDAGRPAARAPAHETLLRAIFQTNVARLAFRVVLALLDRVRDGLLVLFLGVIWFGAAAAGYFFTFVVVPAPVRVIAEASIAAVSCLTIHTVRRGVVLEGLRAGGAGGQNHFDFDLGA